MLLDSDVVTTNKTKTEILVSWYDVLGAYAVQKTSVLTHLFTKKEQLLINLVVCLEDTVGSSYIEAILIYLIY